MRASLFMVEFKLFNDSDLGLRVLKSQVQGSWTSHHSWTNNDIIEDASWDISNMVYGNEKMIWSWLYLIQYSLKSAVYLFVDLVYSTYLV